MYQTFIFFVKHDNRLYLRLAKQRWPAMRSPRGDEWWVRWESNPSLHSGRAHGQPRSAQARAGLLYHPTNSILRFFYLHFQLSRLLKRIAGNESNQFPVPNPPCSVSMAIPVLAKTTFKITSATNVVPFAPENVDSNLLHILGGSGGNRTHGQ